MDLLTHLQKKKKERIKENQGFIKKFNSMTIQERIAYMEHMNSNFKLSFSWLTAPFYAILYLGIFSIIFKYGFNLDLRLPFFLITQIIFQIYAIFIILFVLEVYLQANQRDKTRKLLLNGIKTK